MENITFEQKVCQALDKIEDTPQTVIIAYVDDNDGVISSICKGPQTEVIEVLANVLKKQESKLN